MTVTVSSVRDGGPPHDVEIDTEDVYPRPACSLCMLIILVINNNKIIRITIIDILSVVIIIMIARV